jgi:hypothetical protein
MIGEHIASAKPRARRAPPAVPPQIGDIVAVEVHNDDPKCPQYRWPQASPSKGPGRPGRHPPRRG